MTEPEQKLAEAIAQGQARAESFIDRLEEKLKERIESRGVDDLDYEKAATAGDDAADLAQAVARGYGPRFAFGPYRAVTKAIQAFRVDGDATKYKTAMEAALGAPNPQRACRIATFAVIGLEMANAFGANIPQTVIDEAIALEKQVCGTSTPITPLPPIPAPDAE